MTGSNDRILDEEFKNDLSLIRSFLSRLALPAEPKLCLKWLGKLENSTDERELRNLFLRRLVSQVERGHLNRPFDSLPPPSDVPLSCIELTSSAASGDDMDSEVSGSSCSDGLNAFDGKPNLIAELSRLKQITHLQVQNNNLSTLVKHYKTSSLANENALKSLTEDVHRIQLKLDQMDLVTSQQPQFENHSEMRNILDQISLKLDASSQKIATLESSFNQFKNESKIILGDQNLVRALRIEIREQKIRHNQEIKLLKKMLSSKDYQIARIGSRVEKQCTKMEKRVSCMKQEMNHVELPKQSRNVSEITDIRKNVVCIENINRKLISSLENRFNRSKNEYESKIQALQTELKAKTDASAKLEEVISKMESNYSKLIADLMLRSEKRRKLDAEAPTYTKVVSSD